jgi:DNA-directed RNA polymerase specialized sigma24 family protein
MVTTKMPNSPIDTREVVRLYLEEKLSVREIATRLGSSYGRVYGILRNRVIMRMSDGRGPRRSMRYLGVAEIMREHIRSGEWAPNHRVLSQQELARIFDVSHKTVHDALVDLRRRGYLRTAPTGRSYVRPARYWDDDAVTE